MEEKQSKEDRLKDMISMVGPTDITLIVGEKKIACHKAKLSESSSYFQAMFNSNMLESKAANVELKDVQAHLVRKLVQYCYSHELDLTDANVGDILSTASMYQFLPVISECTQYLSSNLRIDNCLTAMFLADTCTVNQLYREAKRHALWYFNEVVQQADFLNMSVDSLRDYLNNDMLATNEVGVVNAIIRWTTFDGPSRTKHAASLLSQVRLTSMSQDELVEVGQLELVKSNPECVRLVGQNLTRVGEENEKNHSRRTRGVPQQLWVVGGEISADEDRQFIRDVKQYNTETDKFETVTAVPPWKQGEVKGAKACLVGKDLYVIGGETCLGRSQWHYDVWRYDTFGECWDVVSRLRQPRRHHGVIVFGTHIYVVGGFGRYRVVLDSVDRFDTVSREWNNLPDLIQPVFSAAACLCRNTLFVIKHDIQYFVPGQSQTWTAMHMPWPFEIGIHSAVSVDEHIYLVGQYIPQLMRFNTVTRELIDLGRFKSSSGPLCLCNGKIYSVGGGNDGELVESFDREKGEFAVVSELQNCWCNTNVVAAPVFPQFRCG